MANVARVLWLGMDVDGWDGWYPDTKARKRPIMPHDYAMIGNYVVWGIRGIYPGV